MTDLEQRAIDLIAKEYGPTEYTGTNRPLPGDGPARVRAIREGKGNEYWEMRVATKALEAHDTTKAEFEAFRRDVSEAALKARSLIQQYVGNTETRGEAAASFLSRFILPEPVDPIEELCGDIFDNGHKFHAHRLREALAKRGLTITKEARS